MTTPDPTAQPVAQTPATAPAPSFAPAEQQGPAATGPQSPAPATKKPLNVLGLISLIVAGLGFIFACIPGALIVGWILLPIGFVLAVVSLFLKGKGKGLGVAGLIVSIIGTIVGFVVFFTVVAVAFDNAFSAGETTVVTEGSEDTAEAADEGDAAAAEGTRENPYSIGSVIESSEWRVVVHSVALGATDAVLAANELFNEPPAEGSEYIVINYSVTYLGDDPDGQMPAFVGVEYVTADGTTVDGLDKMVIAPDPIFDSTGTLYTDGMATGNVAFEVPSATAAEGVLAIRPGMLADKVFVAVQ